MVRFPHDAVPFPHDAVPFGPLVLHLGHGKGGEGSIMSANTKDPGKGDPEPGSAGPDGKGELEIGRQQRDKMLKLVARGFFNELINYGVDRKEVVRVASHLLDNLLTRQDLSENGIRYLSDLFTLRTVKDEWTERRVLSVDHVSLRPLHPSTISVVASWLQYRHIRESFIPPFPGTEEELEAYFADPQREYFEVLHEDAPVGIIGGENIDEAVGKLEMKKLVGESAQQGKGIGKRATFGFLYYAFMILGMNKVYIHSQDINIRNISLNNRFGFEMEGVFREDFLANGKRADVVRMALMRDTWQQIFSPTD